MERRDFLKKAGIIVAGSALAAIPNGCAPGDVLGDTYFDDLHVNSLTIGGVPVVPGAGAGDMTKAVYDTNNNSIVDKAEAIDDNAGHTANATDIQDAVSKKHSNALDHAQNTDTGTNAANFSINGSNAIKEGDARLTDARVPTVHDNTKHSSAYALETRKLDDFGTPDDNTDLDSNTTNHGLLLKAVAPVAGLTNVPAIENGETVWKNKALFDNTNPAALGTASPGTSLIAARRDHIHTDPVPAHSGSSIVGASFIHGMRVIRKTATETVNNSNTPQADDELVIAVAAYDILFIEYFLRMNQANAAADWTFTISCPAGGTIEYRPIADFYNASVLRAADETSNYPNATTSNTCFNMDAWYIGGANAGNVTFKWSQQNATAANNNMLLNCFARVTKLSG